jgi:putative flippase GtrA
VYEEATVISNEARSFSLPLRSRVWEGIRHPGNWVQLGRYGVVGTAGYIVNNAAFALCVHVLSIDYRLSSVLAFMVSVSQNFMLNRRWTFEAHDGHAGFQAMRFFTVSLAAFGVSFGVLNLLVSVGHLPKVPANALAVIAGIPLSFLGQKLWSFKR